MLEPRADQRPPAPGLVLNAFRHLICWNEIRGQAARPAGSAQRLSASYMLEPEAEAEWRACTVCSTPFGILYVGTGGQALVAHARVSAQRLSASYMLERQSIDRRPSTAWGAQRLSASYMLEPPASKRLVWLGFFMLLARTPFSQAGLRGTPENFPAPVLQVPDVSVIFSFSGIPSSSEFIFPQRIQAVGCSSDIVTPNIPRCMIPEIFRMSHDTEAWLLRGPLDPGVPRNQLRRTRVAQPRNHQTVFRG